MRIYTFILPVLLVGVLQVSGCTSSAPLSTAGGTYISTSAGAHFDQSVERIDGEAGDTIAGLALSRAHRPSFNTDLIYIAAGANGVAVSENGGDTWRLLAVPLVVSDVVALSNGVLVVSGVDGEGQGYVVRSIDEAKSWEPVLTVPVPVKKKGFKFVGNNDPVPSVVIAIAPDPFQADRVYAGTNLGNILVGEQSAKTWRTLTTLSGGFGTNEPVQELFASPHEAGELAVLTTSGELWLVNKDEQIKLKVAVEQEGAGTFAGSENKVVQSMAFISETPDALFVGVNDGALLSRDRGVTWEQLKLPVDTVERFNSAVVAVSPTNAARLFVGINSVVYRSEDGGKSWNVYSLNLKTHTITDILIDSFKPQKVLLVTRQLAV